MRRTAALALLAGLLASCATHREPPPLPSPVAGAVCRFGPDGGPAVADRGIGGTGAPTGAPTGATMQVADRGIGGTGIIGVITGFGSVCVGGQEVALGGNVPVSVDETAADASVLRAGQLVALEAGGPGDALTARSVRVRHEVSGPVEFATAGHLRVAGQDVAVTADTWLPGKLPGVGDWVAVSGLRRPDGAIEATRIDPRTPGPVLVHGTLVADGTSAGGRLRIGQLAVAAPPEAARLVGQEVTASGVQLGADLQAESVVPDRLVTDPAGYFGVGVTGLVVEGFVTVSGNEVRLGRIALPAGRAFGPGAASAFPGISGRALVSFSRTGPGRFVAVSAAGREPGVGAPGSVFTPAPGARGTGSGFEPGAFGPAGRPAGRGFDNPGGARRYGPGAAGDPGGNAGQPGFGPGVGQVGGGDGGGLEPSGRRGGR